MLSSGSVQCCNRCCWLFLHSSFVLLRRWLPLLDSAGLDDVCGLCIQRAVQLDKTSCGVESRLQGLSGKALQRLVLCLATDGYCFACMPRGTSRNSYPGAAGSSYKLYNSEEVASILGQELP
jgi:hypothetical protein